MVFRTIAKTYRGYRLYTELSESGKWRVSIVKLPPDNAGAEAIRTREQGRLPGEFESEQEALNFAFQVTDRRESAKQ